MLSKEIIDKYRNDAEGLANYYSNLYFSKHKREFPINPFQILTDNGIHFVFRNFERIEGLYFPATPESEIDLVAINSNKLITRQRFTAAHELCHFLKDTNNKTCVCYENSDEFIERYAESFASSLLMPSDELKIQIDLRNRHNEKLTLDDVLIISDYFGTSFQACFFRIRSLYPYLLPYHSKYVLDKYKPESKRKEFGLTYTQLYFDLFNAWKDAKNLFTSDFAKQLYKNNYVYNDSRIEGEEVSKEAVAEIVEDLLTNKRNSKYCKEKYDKYCHIAGHSSMYDYIFENALKEHFDIFELLPLNKKLYSCFEYPEHGGKIRQSNPVVLGAKFETIDYTNIAEELEKLNNRVKYLEQNYNSLKKSDIIKEIAKIHHKITVIHPFPDGNGRTSRGFMNQMLLRYGLIPFYVKTYNKLKYIAALELADKYENFDNLYIFLMKSIIESHTELSIMI